MVGQYEDMMGYVRHHGSKKEDRTGTGTLSTFGYQMRFNLQEGFPLLTTKKMHTNSIFGELIWMLRGETNIGFLKHRGIRIWDEWADENGELGPVYGKQWRNFSDGVGRYCGPECTTPHMGIDQIDNVVKQIKANPDSRRLIVTAWNPTEVDQMALPPCHMMFQFYVLDGKLSCQLYQRSADIFLGVPFNIASYALLTHLIALECDLEVGDFIWTGGDCHIYLNHLNQVDQQLTRDIPPFPRIAIDKKPLDEYEIFDFHLFEYWPHPAIKAEVSV